MKFSVTSSLLVSLPFLTAIQAGVIPLPDGYHRYAAPNNSLQWEDCSLDGLPGRECTRFEVPLDWHNDGAGKASLAMIRYPATKQPKLGTLFMNPGGPGGSGLNDVKGAAGDIILQSIGGNYDLVSWDPRGIGKTIPKTACFGSSEEYDTFWNDSFIPTGTEVRGDFTSQTVLDDFYVQLNTSDDLIRRIGEQCIAYSPNVFQYVGTAAAVRDMVAIHDALEGPEKPINYWGMSYGTVVGMYFVNMFPDRVGRVVLDSVVDPRLWANRPTYEFLRNTIESTDETFNGFAEACAKAGPSKCAIAQQNSTAASIRQWTRDLLDAVYDYKREAGASALFTSADIRNEIHTKLYNPQKWSNLSSGLYAVKETLDNPTAANLTQAKRWLSETFSPMGNLESRAEPNNSSGTPAYGYELEAVSCSDAQDGDVTTKDVFDAIVNVTQNFSPMCK
ncbi:unnamed protein product [Rhizoctonia solani]|uniref:AB hydrolase-1 domain-containing protein n=1 Tax=Rhizoctonia solani TaxID=456999 RepID=A0A8H3HPB8_9AGAM|nr:unnamed protein product [Rhizoctonia solani]